MTRLLPLLCFLWCLPFWGAAQPAQTARAEILLNNSFRDFRVWPQPDSSVLVLKLEKAFRRNAEPFTLLGYNPNLELDFQRPVAVPKNSQFLFGTVFQKTAYLLFEGQRRHEMLLVRFNTITRQQTITKHQLPESMTFRIMELKPLDGYIFIIALQLNRHIVLHLDPAVTEIGKIPAIFDQSSALSDFQADTLTRRAEFIMAESNGQKGRLQIKRLAPDGRLYSLSFLQDMQNNYLAGRLSPGDSSAKLLAGTYSPRDLRYEQGFFAGAYVPGNNSTLKYHDFTSFSHYFDHLRPARQEKLRRKVERFRLTQKQYQLRQRLLLHRMYPLPEGYLLVGEFYYPHYQNDGAGKGSFDGFQFPQAIVAAIDREGNLLWENSFPLQNIRTYDLKEMVRVGIWGRKVFLSYLDGEKLWYKEVQNAETTSNDKFITLSPLNPADKATSSYPENVVSWYNQHFITYGVQSLRGPKGYRTVFFLNKVSFK